MTSPADRLVSPWYPGLTCDHLYDDCPSRQRGLPELRRYDMDFVGAMGLDPLGTDVCGMCVHRWKREDRLEVRAMTTPVCRVTNCDHPTTDIGEARDNLAAIIDLYAYLLDQAFYGGHDGHLEADRPYPTDAMTILGPTCNLEAWAHQTATRVRATITGREWITDDHDHDGDHPALVLAYWDDMWRNLNQHLPHPTPTISSTAGYLDQNMTGMANEPRALFAEFAADMHNTRARLEAILYAGERDEKGAPCLHCRALLVRRTAPPNPGARDQGGLRDMWDCPRCHRTYGTAEYWNAVAAAYRANAPALTADDIHTEYGVPTGSIRGWASLGKVRKRGRDLAGRILYDVADTRRAANLEVVA
jgi:hypothetical protein